MPSKSDFTNFLTYFPYSSKEKLSIGLITKPSILSVLEILFFASLTTSSKYPILDNSLTNGIFNSWEIFFVSSQLKTVLKQIL